MAGKDNINGGKSLYKWREETIEIAGRDYRNSGKSLYKWREETIEMAGRTIRYFANDPNIFKKTGM